MSRQRSGAQRIIRKYGKMADQYQQRIERQVQIITRLQHALMAYGDALEDILNAQDVDAAKKHAQRGLDLGKAFLAVPDTTEKQEQG